MDWEAERNKLIQAINDALYHIARPDPRPEEAIKVLRAALLRKR